MEPHKAKLDPARALELKEEWMGKAGVAKAQLALALEGAGPATGSCKQLEALEHLGRARSDGEI